MNVDMIRTLYDYHFATNRRLWDECIMVITSEQFTEANAYSEGSIRNQIIHIINWDEQWFNRLKLDDSQPKLDPNDFPNRATVRPYWDQVETAMRRYLTVLDETHLNDEIDYRSRRIGDQSTPVWQILLHVVNHATDHRAQLLIQLHNMGAPTFQQDLMLYLGSLSQNR